MGIYWDLLFINCFSICKDLWSSIRFQRSLALVWWPGKGMKNWSFSKVSNKNARNYSKLTMVNISTSISKHQNRNGLFFLISWMIVPYHWSQFLKQSGCISLANKIEFLSWRCSMLQMTCVKGTKRECSYSNPANWAVDRSERSNFDVIQQCISLLPLLFGGWIALDAFGFLASMGFDTIVSILINLKSEEQKSIRAMHHSSKLLMFLNLIYKCFYYILLPSKYNIINNFNCNSNLFSSWIGYIEKLWNIH